MKYILRLQAIRYTVKVVISKMWFKVDTFRILATFISLFASKYTL